jgi:hypothetical protein
MKFRIIWVGSDEDSWGTPPAGKPRPHVSNPAHIKDPHSFIPRIARLMELAIRLEGLVKGDPFKIMQSLLNWLVLHARA